MRFRLESGLGLAYWTRGRGRTIVLLHPVGLCGAFWREVADELEGEFRLIVPDAPGHGESDVPSSPFDLDSIADDVCQLVRAVGQPPTVVVGCSMGGMIAQAIAVRAPELIAGVVIANTAHRRNDEGRAVMEARSKSAEAGMPNVLEITLGRWFDADIQIRRPDLVLAARNWLIAADPIVHSWSWRAIRDLHYADSLSALKAPALVIAGIRDRSTPLTAMKEMATTIPTSVYREMDTGHLAPLEQPTIFAEHVRDFVRTLV